MGWSCNRDAMNTMDIWTAACRENSGSQNQWTDKNGTFFFEHSRTEHDDGAITGSIFKNTDGINCKKNGTFRINGDGTVARAPKFLKANSG